MVVATSHAPKSEGMESKPQNGMMRAPLLTAAASCWRIMSNTQGVSPVMSTYCVPLAAQAATSSLPYSANGPAVLSTTAASRARAFSALASCASATTMSARLAPGPQAALTASSFLAERPASAQRSGSPWGPNSLSSLAK